MKKIFVIGAGRSATTMIKYLLDNAEAEGWQVTVGDYNGALAREKVGDHPQAEGIAFDVYNEAARKQYIGEADLVISLLPPDMHIIPARDCLAYKTHLVTASYVSDELNALHEEAEAADLIFLNEVGVDPGIDHMSAMEMVHRVEDEGGELKVFRSYCGALVAPESANMWGYKFTWAPRNIILAGQGVAKYRKDGHTKYLPYHHLFRRYDEVVVPGYGTFEAYANRDSLKYAPKYGIEGADTLYRATLRMQGYCDLWNAFIYIGLTNEGFRIPNSAGMTYRDFIFSFLNPIPGKSDAESLAQFLGQPVDGPVMTKIVALDMLTDTRIKVENGSPADILEEILLERWVFEDDDVDMVVMQHQLEYVKDGQRKKLVSSMVDKGRDHEHTAISRTVGLPAAMCAKLILQGKVAVRGVVIPVTPDIYQPVLAELSEYEITFEEEEFLMD